MATNTCTVSGQIVLPDDTDVTGGRLVFRLSSYDVDGGETVSEATVVTTIGGDGSVSVDLWPNHRGVKASYYTVSLVRETSAGDVAFDLGRIQVPDESSADISDLLGAPLVSETVNWTTLTASELDALTTEEELEDAITYGGVVNLNNYGGTAQAVTADTNANTGNVVIASGLKVAYRPPSSNTGPNPTLALNGGDAYQIKRNGGSDVVEGEIVGTRLHILRLSGGEGSQRWEVVSGSGNLYENTQPYSSRAAFISATVLAPVVQASFVVNGRKLDVIDDADGEIGPTADGRMWSPANAPHLWHFITNATPGTTNITEAVRKLLTFCTEAGQTAHFDGVGFGLIDTDAEITYSCSVEWGGLIVQGNEEAVIGNPVAGDVTRMLIIEDSTTPLVTGTITTGDDLTQSNLAIGSHTPTADYFEGPGYARFQMNGVQIPNRDRDAAGTATEDWDQSVWVNRSGTCVYPMSVDGSSSTSVNYQYRAAPASGWITQRGLTVDMDSFNHCQVMTVARNFVNFETTQALPGASPVSDSCNRLIYVMDAGKFTIDGMSATAQEPGGDGGGTYIFRARGAAEVTIENVLAQEGWGMMATDQMNGFYVKNCAINRVDTHGLSGNFFISDTTLREHGVTYGAFFGVMKITNPTLNSCPALHARSDYGGYCFGDLSVTGKINYISNGGRAIIVDHETNPIGVEGFDLPVAYSVHVGEITVSQANDNASGTTLCPWALTVETDCDVYVPHTSVLEGAKGFKIRVELPLDFNNLQRWDTDDDANFNDEPVPILEISRMRGVRAPTAVGDGLYFPANTISGAGDFDLKLLIDNCLNFSVDLGDFDGAEIKTHDNQFYRFNATNRIVSKGDEFLEAQLGGAETEASAGGTGSLFFNALVTGDNWDFADANAIIGMVIENSPSNVSLPATVTESQAFTGWQA
ncbi:hypothetical protein [Roseovarius sp.]|uniref:hypothetical protein n=1 Tax=Roseovarius sp. TaxID=1486281 RepID=UPI003D0A99B5